MKPPLAVLAIKGRIDRNSPMTPSSIPNRAGVQRRFNKTSSLYSAVPGGPPSGGKNPRTIQNSPPSRPAIARICLTGHPRTKQAEQTSLPPYAYPIFLIPIHFLGTSGMTMLPSGCCWFSRRAITARVIATAVPLSVWTKCVPFLSASLQRMPRRRNWKSVQFEAEVISPYSPVSPPDDVKDLVRKRQDKAGVFIEPPLSSADQQFEAFRS